MKKQILLKIIATTSLLLGSLGPQVVSGQVSLNVSGNETVRQNIEVGFSLAPQMLSVVDGSSSFSFEACDLAEPFLSSGLLLWNKCQLQLTMARPQALPELVVENSYVPGLIKVVDLPSFQTTPKLSQNNYPKFSMVFAKNIELNQPSFIASFWQSETSSVSFNHLNFPFVLNNGYQILRC